MTAEPCRILVTGSRTWSNAVRLYCELYATCDAVLERPGGSLVSYILIHGACPSGADAMASEWCQERAWAHPSYYREERHPADWNRDGRAQAREVEVTEQRLVISGHGRRVVYQLRHDPLTRCYWAQWPD